MTSAPFYEGLSGKNAVAICINVDWGEDYIPGMLQTLKQHDAKATFFLTGRWTESFPDSARLIKKYGMEIEGQDLFIRKYVDGDLLLSGKVLSLKMIDERGGWL